MIICIVPMVIEIIRNANIQKTMRVGGCYTHFALRFGGETRLGGPVVCHFRLRTLRDTGMELGETDVDDDDDECFDCYARPRSTVINSIMCCDR